jgi:hypothetical protein
MASESGSVQFSIGSVIGSSFGVYARNFISFTILALLIGLIELVIGFIWPAPAQDGFISTTEVGYTGVIVTILVTLLVYGLTQAAIIYGTFQDLRGQKASIGDCIARGLSTAVPVIVGSILLSLGVLLASFLLIVPGIILALMWWVYIPVVVVEGKGITGSFGRSSELTSGRRWHILGLVIVVILLTVVASFIVGLIIAAVMVGAGVGRELVATIIKYAVSSVVTAFSSILVAVGYYYLRAEKEGINVDDIARVFD